ncbi:hypothetical protein Cfor_02508 [Coptotermes formosanus]|uniref:Uncharacterized protein n=1 Tax=Coptotermes formosanus TaxID=36987 RepID=A0A6L2PPV8_COPFO|nr:hypothetical protein Cfor_02508 [Coptotermes formosanus]
MVERWRDAERVEDSDSVPGPKQDDVGEGKLHHLEGERREGVDQWRDQVVLKDSEVEDDNGVSASNAIALAAKKCSESRPSFGNIVVNSSSDVHFGNKTFYNGPVTIKQFVYTTRDGNVDVHNSEVGDKNDDLQVDVVEGLDEVPSGVLNGKVHCPELPSENFISAHSALTSELSPEVNGSLLPIWQSSTSEYRNSKIRSNIQDRN